MMRGHIRNPGLVTIGVACFLSMLPGLLCAQDASPTAARAPQAEAGAESNLYVKVQLENRVKLSGLKPGDVVEGKLSRSVYSREKELLPAGSRVRLTVDKMAQRRRVPNDHWPWVIKAFTPRHEKYPTFQSAQVSLAGGEEVPLRVSLVSIGREVEVMAETKKENGGKRAKNSAAANAELPAPREAASEKSAKERKTPPASFTANFEAVVLKKDGSPESPLGLTSGTSRQAMSIEAGTQARVVLLEGISASKSRPGDAFQARLVEPVLSGTVVALPEGSIFEGRIVKKTGPRMLSRSGSILVSFTSVTIPGGTSEPIEASLEGVELDRRSHTRIDPEGQLKGERPGNAWMAINLGVTAGIAKETDDGLQLLIEAIVSTATDASTAGTARIAGACASSLFMLTRHGRDVVLPKFTEMDIVFDRSVSLSPSEPLPIAAQDRGQARSSDMEK
ncbi:MAG: hypothetical protein WB995_14565 [Candidatus Acidiferrales bacterium]